MCVWGGGGGEGRGGETYWFQCWCRPRRVALSWMRFGTNLRAYYLLLTLTEFKRSKNNWNMPNVLEKLDYQVSIYSLIPPATAISKTQDRADTSVWWKLPFSIFFIIYYVQRAIINKVCKPELWFLRSAHSIIVLYIFMKLHEDISNYF